LPASKPNTNRNEAPSAFLPSRDDADVHDFIVSANIRRRHQDATDLAITAAKLVNMKLGDNQHTDGAISINKASDKVGASRTTTKRVGASLPMTLPAGQSPVLLRWRPAWFLS